MTKYQKGYAFYKKRTQRQELIESIIAMSVITLLMYTLAILGSLYY